MNTAKNNIEIKGIKVENAVQKIIEDSTNLAISYASIYRTAWNNRSY